MLRVDQLLEGCPAQLMDDETKAKSGWTVCCSEIGARMVEIAGGEAMGGWDGDALAGQMEEVFERQQAAADARAHRGTSSAEERARSADFESLRLSRSLVLSARARPRPGEASGRLAFAGLRCEQHRAQQSVRSIV